MLGLLVLAIVAFNLTGNLLLGVAIWRSGSLPKWTGAAWASAAVFMYALGIVYSVLSGSQSTPPTVLLGAVIAVIAGGWIAWCAARVPFVAVPA